MVNWDHRKTSTISADMALTSIAANESPTVSAASPIDSKRFRCCEASCDASPTRPLSNVSANKPNMPIAREALSPAASHNFSNSTKCAAKSPRRDANRYWRTTRHAAQHAWRSCLRHRSIAYRRAGPPAPSSVSQQRCLARLTTHQRAYATDTRHAHHRRLPDVRRSRRHFSSAAAGSPDSMAVATRRCSSARSDLSWDS